MSIDVKPRTRDGKTIFYLSGTYLGERVRLSLGTADHAEARQLAATLLPRLLQRIQDGQLHSDTFAGIAHAYVASGKSDRFLAALVAHFGKRQLNDITDNDVIDYANDRGAARDWTNTTKNRHVIKPFQAVANFGARMNPPKCGARRITPFVETRVPITVAPEAWILAAVAAAWRDGHAKLAAMIMFMTTTGVRVSEACRLEWRDVDLEASEALILKTKNTHPRRVPLAASVAEILAHLSPPLGAGLVFGYRNRSGVANRLAAICKRHGLAYYSSHKWGRHAFAARLFRMNKSSLMVKDAGGWRSIGVVLDTYGHLERGHVDSTVHEGAAELGSVRHLLDSEH
ncbi:MAG: tyrosine-type recombinase/integrase [Hyphomicrobiaceae bacterium]